MDKNTLIAVEHLVAENSRLHKEIQELRTGNDVEAYTPYRDAGYAFDILREIGFGQKSPDITLAELIKEVRAVCANMQQTIQVSKIQLDSYKDKEDAIYKISIGQDDDIKDLLKRHPIVKRISQLRATLELVKMRLERLEKLNYDEDIHQLYFDLDRFLSKDAGE